VIPWVGMTKRLRHGLWIFAVLSSLLAPATATEYYKLEGVKRLDKDLYRSGKFLIETRNCFHFTSGENASLKYETTGEFSGSKIIWADDSTCEVRKLIEK
jgi:hypothetical protein